ncbi:MAG TPA: response regulator, partial [Gemmatimonadaceae bacterium]|nr:response regulator [Gemmatimonadaceae bacterium]
MAKHKSVTKRDRPARILIVDDQEQNIRLLTRILEKDGHDQVRSTTNSAEALSIYTDFKPDLVVLDVHMREKDGFQVLQEIVAHNGSSHVPVLMVTA